jgi:hypothetical protein
MLGIEDKWDAPAGLLLIGLPLSLRTAAASSFRRKPDEMHLATCLSFNQKHNETKV